VDVLGGYGIVRDRGGGTNVVYIEAGGNIVYIGVKGKLELEEGGSTSVVYVEVGIIA